MKKVHDSNMMKKLVKHVLNKGNKLLLVVEEVGEKNKIHSFTGDGAYDRNANFKFLKYCCNIRPIIKVRRNFVVSHTNNKIRNREVKQQTKDFFKLKNKNRYGYRWMV